MSADGVEFYADDGSAWLAENGLRAKLVRIPHLHNKLRANASVVR